MKLSETEVVCVLSVSSSPSTPQHTTPTFFSVFFLKLCWELTSAETGFYDPLRKIPGVAVKNLTEELAANVIKRNNDHFSNELLEVFFLLVKGIVHPKMKIC